MQHLKPFRRYLAPGVLAVSLLAVYLASMAPGLTWANIGSDGGDLISAAATGGIAHPTGYPFYLLLARLFQFFPIGSLAFRTNLMSAIAAVVAAILVYFIVTGYLSPYNPQQFWLAGLVAGLAFGLSPLVWSQAVITEVYTLHALFVALLLFLSIQATSSELSQKRLDCLLGLIFGLAMGNHLTTIMVFPILILPTLLSGSSAQTGTRWKIKWQLNGRSLFRRLAWVLIGLLVYLTLPLRALSHPPVNWGNPITLDGFFWLVSGKLYQGLLLGLSFSSILQRAQTVVALLFEQFGIIGLGIGLIGLIVDFRSTRLNYYMLWIVVASSVFAVGYATADAFLYLIPAFLCFAIWIGIGLGGLISAFSKRFRGIGIVVASVFLLTFFVQTRYAWPSVDASHDQRAESFGSSVLSLAPARALVFAKGDEAVFTMWYFQYALRDRPDLAIISTDLLQFPWYLQTLRSTYPDLNLPGPFPFSETVVMSNPGRPVCYIQYVQAPEINCLPVGNSQSP